MDEKILAFLYERVGINTGNKLEQGFLSEFGRTCRYFSSCIDEELLFNWAVGLSFDVRLLIHSCQVAILNDEEISLRIRDPFVLRRLGSSS